MAAREYRINGRIRVPSVVLISPNGGGTQSIRTEDARRMAIDAGLDLVEVAPNQSPPVCRILDYGKFKYELAKKEKQLKRNANASNQMREIRLTPQISDNDLNSKMTIMRGMLNDGAKVKLTVILKGRMVTRPEMGMELLEKVRKIMQPLSKEDRAPTREKRSVSMILAPLARSNKREQNSNGETEQISKKTSNQETSKVKNA